MAPLFDESELSDWLQYDVSQPAAAIAEKVVAGWLTDATELDEWPDPVPSRLFAWALELGGIAHENPGGLDEETSADATSKWGRRRAEILAAAKAWAGGSPVSPGPEARGCFPDAQPWPDAAGRW